MSIGGPDSPRPPTGAGPVANAFPPAFPSHHISRNLWVTKHFISLCYQELEP